jgi:hypothetical protein
MADTRKVAIVTGASQGIGAGLCFPREYRKPYAAMATTTIASVDLFAYQHNISQVSG